MAWNKKYYNACKKHMEWQVSHRPCVYEGDIVKWLKGCNRVVKDFADAGDYEAAQASKDAILEFISKVTEEPISNGAILVFD